MSASASENESEPTVSVSPDLEALWSKAASTIPIIEAFADSVESELGVKLPTAEANEVEADNGEPDSPVASSLESVWSKAVSQMSVPLDQGETETLPGGSESGLEDSLITEVAGSSDTNWHDEDNQVVAPAESPFAKRADSRSPISVVPSGDNDLVVTSVPLPIVIPVPIPVPVPSVSVGEESRSAGSEVVLPELVDPVVASSPVIRKTSKKSGKSLKATVRILNAQEQGLSVETIAKAKRTASRKRRDGHMVGGIRLTPRDHAMLTFLARYRVATVGQLARAFGTSSTALRNRLPRLKDAGLITWVWGANSKPKLWMITEAGLDTVGIHLTAPTIKWGQLRHTMGLTDLGIHFEAAGETVLTEREIRAAATRYSPTTRMRSAIGLIGESSYDLSGMTMAEANEATAALVRSKLILPVKGRAYGHIPDMVLSRQPFPNGASSNISIELELTRKSMSEWNTILTTYNNSDAFAEVLYFVISNDIKRALNLVIKSVGAMDKIKVVMFSPVDLAADPVVTGGGGQIHVDRSPKGQVEDSQDALEPGIQIPIPIPTDDAG
jgi:hypothetical protein